MQIVNIVASGDLHQKISLPELKEQLGDRMRYDTSKYHGGYIDLGGIKATIYQSGKYIFSGVKSVDDVREYYKRLSDILSAYLDSSLFAEPTRSEILLRFINIRMSSTWPLFSRRNLLVWQSLNQKYSQVSSGRWEEKEVS